MVVELPRGPHNPNPQYAATEDQATETPRSGCLGGSPSSSAQKWHVQRKWECGLCHGNSSHLPPQPHSRGGAATLVILLSVSDNTRVNRTGSKFLRQVLRVARQVSHSRVYLQGIFVCSHQLANGTRETVEAVFEPLGEWAQCQLPFLYSHFCSCCIPDLDKNAKAKTTKMLMSVGWLCDKGKVVLLWLSKGVLAPQCCSSAHPHVSYQPLPNPPVPKNSIEGKSLGDLVVVKGGSGESEGPKENGRLRGVVIGHESGGKFVDSFELLPGECGGGRGAGKRVKKQCESSCFH